MVAGSEGDADETDDRFFNTGSLCLLALDAAEIVFDVLVFALALDVCLLCLLTALAAGWLLVTDVVVKDTVGSAA